MQYTQTFIQVGLLAVVAFIGIGFTFALPTPRHHLKAKSVVYARWFLFSSWLVVAFQGLAQNGYGNIGLPGVYGAATLSAYLLLMSVNKRYGHEIARIKKYAAALHIVILIGVTLVLKFAQYQPWLAHALALSSIAFPVWLAQKRVQQSLNKETFGSRLLYSVLWLVLLMVLVAVPVYLGNIAPQSPYHLTATFALILVIMLTFMLSFAANILQSLLVKLHSLVHTDPLTGAKNRYFFYETAPKLSAHARRNNEVLSVVACDIDHFKSVNDEHGHVVGDIALKRFCEIIQEQLRLEDTLIRMGGEEFLILSPQCDGEQARLMAERLRETISETKITARDVTISLTASFGVIEMPDNADLLSAVKHADLALFDAKAKGRNQVIMV
ncbi:GGDEF domain-containing protein [Alteromonas gilva]|uniref:diguanylate cyclase n=1 Tax=Alteromonas gilva TaxID=2987522 RepID=A0ABT5L0U7_9ALTE|nr:GGDEF domain-containing protein [Alteromonas gilva]MDC8830096.1 GGDEF domain-containing protein [Alteromonas gilva]